jgi:hypothetical protein
MTLPGSRPPGSPFSTGQPFRAASEQQRCQLITTQNWPARVIRSFHADGRTVIRSPAGRPAKPCVHSLQRPGRNVGFCRCADGDRAMGEVESGMVRWQDVGWVVRILSAERRHD